RVLYEQGLHLQAHALTAPYQPLHALKETESRLLAARLATHLGAPRLSRYLIQRAYHADRAHPEARYYYAHGVLERAGPFAAWEFLKRGDDLPDAPLHVRCAWLALRGRVAGLFRDFEEAERWFARAEAADPGDLWLWVERAASLQDADRYEEALEAA